MRPCTSGPGGGVRGRSRLRCAGRGVQARAGGREQTARLPRACVSAHPALTAPSAPSPLPPVSTKVSRRCSLVLAGAPSRTTQLTSSSQAGCRHCQQVSSRGGTELAQRVPGDPFVFRDKTDPPPRVTILWASWAPARLPLCQSSSELHESGVSSSV